MVVDNASSDRSVQMVRSDFPRATVVQSRHNLGYAGGCNLGIRSSESDYVVLLNNDAVVSPGWLDPLVTLLESNHKIAAVQPKILSIQNREYFDYCGAAGGEIDFFGYPYARGRLFQTIETDDGQYENEQMIFWASGAATMLRRSALDEIGLLDDFFFAHMEEIDLNWRLQKAGFIIAYQPRSVVYHQTGGTLSQESFRKMRLNQRNNLIMVLKNYSIWILFWILPVRILLDFCTVLAFPVLGVKRAAAVIAGWFTALASFPVILHGRKEQKRHSKVSDCQIMRRMYPGSIAFAYYVFGIRKSPRNKFCETFPV